ncbi:MAG: hypothetical protein ABIR54_00175 [Burkholderiaceae bacterium]
MTHPPSLVVHLESPYGEYEAGAAPARDVILMGLGWTTPWWPALAVGWLEQGAPLDEEIVACLEAIGGRKKWPQDLRQRAAALARRWQTRAAPQ